MPLLLPAIQAAREAAAVEVEGDEALEFFLGGIPNASSDLGEFVYGTELPAVQDGTSNTVFVGESLLPPANGTDGAHAAPPPRPLPAPILTGGKERQDDIIDVIVSLPPPPDEPMSGWLFEA